MTTRRIRRRSKGAFYNKRDANESGIIDGLEVCGWQVTQHETANWPDLTLEKGRRFVWVEVKMPGKKPSEEQEKVQRRLRECGQEVHLAYSLDILLRDLGEI